MSLERGEDDSALARLVVVLEEKAGHEVSMPPKS